MKKTVIFLILMISLTLLSDLIELPKNPDVPQWKAELVQETELEDVQTTIFDLFYHNNKVYLSDSNQPAVVVYNLDGNYVQTVGNEGEGPGEFLQVIYIWSEVNNDYFVAYDERSNKLSHFSFDGNFIEAEVIANVSKPSHRSRFSNMDVIETGEMKYDGTVKNNITVKLYISDEPKTLFEASWHPFLIGWYNLDKPYYAAIERKLFLTTASRNDYEIKIFNPAGELIREIKKKCDPVQLPKDKLAEAKDFAKTAEERFRKSVEISKDIYGYKKIVRNIYADDKEQIWLATTDIHGDLLDVYNEQGDLIAQCRPESSDLFDRAHIQDGFIYSVVVDAAEEGYLLRKYKIVK